MISERMNLMSSSLGMGRWVSSVGESVVPAIVWSEGRSRVREGKGRRRGVGERKREGGGEGEGKKVMGGERGRSG